jgi:hypothetical protein
MENLQEKRLLLSRKNIGKPLKIDCINIFKKFGILNLTIDSFLDLEISDLYLKNIENFEFNHINFEFHQKEDLKNYVDELNISKNILFFCKYSEYCGLLEIEISLIKNNIIEILQAPFFAGYFTIYSKEIDFIIEFDFEENNNEIHYNITESRVIKN